MAYYVYKDAASYWRWRLIAANNRIIADSAESYHNKADCLSAIGLVKGSGNAPVYARLNCTETPTFWHRQFFEPLLNGKRLFSCAGAAIFSLLRSEEQTSELQSQSNLL